MTGFARALAALLIMSVLVVPAASFAEEAAPEEAVPPVSEEAAPAPVETASSTEAAPSEPLPAPAAIDPEIVPGEIVVKYDDRHADLATGAGQQLLEDAAAAQSLEVKDILPDQNLALLAGAGGDAGDEIAALNADPHVEYAEPNYRRSIDAIPTDDTYRDLMWALENTGQTVNGTTGTADADLDGLEAWNYSTGTSTVVAVIDTGVDYTHPDLANQMWDGSSCLDDAGAALGACVGGYDFVSGDKNPAPVGSTSDQAHGTHVAGIIAAEKNNGAGGIGIAPSAKIMALRFGLDTISEVKAINFARENGAKIINASFGGSAFSQAEYDAIEDFTQAGGIFVASAGNGGDDQIGDDLDQGAIYPAAYDLAGIVSVAATDQSDALADFSNYGEDAVDVAAPGRNVVSAVPGNAYSYKSGTSMAAPYVAGTFALGMSLRPDLSASVLKGAFLASGDSLATLSGKTVSGKRVNAAGFLARIATGTPDLTIPVLTLIEGSTMHVAFGASFTDPGATFTDDVDATTTVYSDDSVDTSSSGSHSLRYNATDSSGNAAAEISRTVIVDPEPSRRRSGGGGGGGGGGSKKSEPAISRTLFGDPATLTPEARAALIQELLAQVRVLLALLAQMRANGL